MLLLLINENDVKFNIDFKAKKIIYNASILESVFYNLISNSIKYGPVDKQIEISISTKKGLIGTKLIALFPIQWLQGNRGAQPLNLFQPKAIRFGLKLTVWPK